MPENKVHSDKTAETASEKSFDDIDGLLQRLVIMANDGLEIGITLLAEGVIVSGTLIGGEQYFKIFGANFASIFDYLGNEKQDEIRDLYAEEGRKIYKKPEGDTTAQAPIFVHLKNAQYFSPGAEPIPQEGLLWRGRLTKVSGFTLGRFSTNRPK